MRLESTWLCAPTGLFCQPQMIHDDCDRGAIVGLKIDKGNRNTPRKPAPVQLCPPQIPHDLSILYCSTYSRWICNTRINSGVMKAVSKERIGKHAPVETNTQLTIDLPSTQGCFRSGPCRDVTSRKTGTRVQYTVALLVVGGDEKRNLESEKVKCGHESYGIRTRERLRWRGPATIVNVRALQSSEREPHINKPATV
jgi:hypothetical protein